MNMEFFLSWFGLNIDIKDGYIIKE